MKNETKGTLLVLLTALESGVAIVFNRFFVQQIDPTLFTAIRAFFIGLIFLIITKVTKSEKKVPLKKTIWIGLIGGGLAFLLFFNGLKLTTSGRAAFIHKTLPIWASLLAYFFLNEKISKEHILALTIAMLGFSIMEIDVISSSVRLGDFLALLATILWAIENTISKQVMKAGETNWRITFIRMFFGSLFLFGVVSLQGKLPLLLTLNPAHWLWIGFSTLMLTWYVLTWYWGLKYINLSKASSLLILSPIIAVSLGAIFLKETIRPLQLAGSFLILVSSILFTKLKSKERKISE